MNIPEQVSELAARYGFNSVSLAKHVADEDIYSVECVDGQGFPLPVGLPAFIIFDGKSCKLADGEEGFALSCTLFGDE